jgi:ribosomal protein S18 acetylase RimI-like enzyme
VSSAVSIRLAGPGDVERIADLTVRAYVAEGLLSSDDRYVDELRAVAARLGLAEVWVAVFDGSVVGAVTFCPPGSAYRELAADGEGEFRMLAVDPSARGRGAARSLVQRCIDRCTELGLDELVICSMPTMTPAHRLYYSLGFSRDESLDWDVHEELRLWGFRAGVPQPPYV